MTEKILPLGTVVTLKNGNDDYLMIISRASIIEQNGEYLYYDYGSVLVPEGMIVPDRVYFFNREQVKEVIFQGFKNDNEIEYENGYDEMVARSGIKKGSVN